jgi:rhodanese-related sulfurtransferase
VDGEEMFGTPLPEIDVKTLAEKLKSEEEFVLLDVREEDELLLAKISDKRMVHLPLSKLASEGNSALPASARNPDQKVYVICHHGNRSMQVTRWLMKLGLGNIVNVRGGIDDYARQVDRSVGMY